MCWDVIPPVTGHYIARASVPGDSFEKTFFIDADSQLGSPEITNLDVSLDQVTFEWTAPSETQSFLVRVNPDPFTGTITGEMVVPGNLRSATLSGLSLVGGTRFQAVVWGFSHDVKTPGPLAGQFNLASDDVFFTAPFSDYLHWPLGTRDGTRELVMGHGIWVVQNYANETHPDHVGQDHTGMDLRLDNSLEGWRGTVGEPVYAIADGVVECDNRPAADVRRNYPGRVVVLRHRLGNGTIVYSQYAHVEGLRFRPGQLVRRGETIATVFPWPDSPLTAANDITNSHLHFEIREFPFWFHAGSDSRPVTNPPARPEDNISCAGPGYAPRGKELENQPWTLKWLDPVDTYYANRPRFPWSAVTRQDGELAVREDPSTRSARVGTLPPSSRVTAYRVRRDSGGERHRWYEVRRRPLRGYISGFRWYGYNGDIQVGEPLRDGWTRALIDYRFDRGELRGGTISNLGRAEAMDGTIVGNAGLAYRQDPVLDPDYRYNPRYARNLDQFVQDRALELDGETAFLEVNRSRGVTFRRGVAVEAWVWRRSNAGEDAIVSKWYGGEDQWLLTIYPDRSGKLIFTVRLEDGTSEGLYKSLEHFLPDERYLNTWVHVAALYQPEQGLRLYWDRTLVGSTPPLYREIKRGRQPIHVGDASNEWSRFDGRIDDVKVWVPQASDRILP